MVSSTTKISATSQETEQWLKMKESGQGMFALWKKFREQLNTLFKYFCNDITFYTLETGKNCD